MIKYVVKTTDGSIARYNNIYVEVEADATGVKFTYSTGISIFYPNSNIIWFRREEVDDDESED